MLCGWILSGQASFIFKAHMLKNKPCFSNVAFSFFCFGLVVFDLFLKAKTTPN